MKKIDLTDFNDYDPKTEILDTEYNFKKKPIPFHEIFNYKPIFSYKYLSFDGSEFCFNNKNIEAVDFRDLFFVKKELSSETFDSIYDTRHFHWIQESGPLGRINKLFKKYKKKYKIDREAIPDFFQFAVSTGPDKSPRVIGFIGSYGVFNIVWFDLNHQIYPKV